MTRPFPEIEPLESRWMCSRGSARLTADGVLVVKGIGGRPNQIVVEAVPGQAAGELLVRVTLHGAPLRIRGARDAPGSASSSDVTRTAAVAVRVIGGRRADTILVAEGVPVPAFIWGRGGNDHLVGGTSDDLIDGGPGGDVLEGGAGSDVLIGGPGRDTLTGGPEGKGPTAQSDADTLRGGAGDDILAGGAGDDRLLGDKGNDVLRGGVGADRLLGDGGGDTLDAGVDDDADQLVGGKGRDTFFNWTDGELDDPLAVELSGPG